jgi:uncharacterized delta-60 repeat protein
MTKPQHHHTTPYLCYGLLTFVFVLFFSAMTLSAQSPGTLDESFATGSTVNNSVRTVAPAGDGKVYIGGDFTTVRGAFRNRIARLNADGNVDTSFNPVTGASGEVRSLLVQSDGKVLISGTFTSFNGTARSRIARLSLDGSLDTSFAPGTGANSEIRVMALQSDGKVVIGGFFTNYNGTARNCIARLNADGSLDTNFNPGTGANSFVYSAVIQPDGKMIIGGIFTSYNGTTRNQIARLNADGSLDTGFNPGSGVNGSINSLVVQSDGKVLIGGNFSSYNGTARSNIARLNTDGSLDATFNPGTGANSIVNSVALQADGKAFIGGDFTSYNGTVIGRIARLNTTGTLDTTFNPGTGANSIVDSVALQAGGTVLICGGFSSYNGVESSRIARLNSNGSLNTSFTSSSGSSSVSTVALQPDGKVLIGGSFTSFNGLSRNSVARLNANGSLDTSFDPGTGANSTVRTIVVQPDGKVVIGGDFTSYNGTSRNYIARLNANGSLDTSFNPGTGANSRVRTIVVQPDGKVIIGGDFNSYNGTSRNYVARLNANGSLDTAFTPGTGANSSVYSIALQADGKIIICGHFTSYSGTARNRIARLNADGSLDTSFNPGTGVSAGGSVYVYAVLVQSDGKVLIGGDFTGYNGTARNRIARLNANGSLDTSFNPGTGFNGFSGEASLASVALQVDGKLLVGGYFTSYNGTQRSNFARLNADGSLDTNFGTGINDSVNSIALQADGKVLIGGQFTNYNGTLLRSLARISSSFSGQNLAASSSSRIGWLRGGATPEVEQVSFERSPDGVVWTALGSGVRITGGWELTGLNLPTSGQLRARGRANQSGSSIIQQTTIYNSFLTLTTPTVTQVVVTGITSNAATGASEVTADGGETVIERGLVYATTPDPTLATGTKVVSGSGLGSFTGSLSALATGTTYYVRAYATNLTGTGYSSSTSFSSLPSTNADLAALALSSGTLSPVFAPATLSYTASVNNTISSVTITPTRADATSTVTVNGGSPATPVPLNLGPNVINILVTAQDGTSTKNYTVTLTRVPSTNANLASLALTSGSLSPAFSSGTLNYSVSVPGSTSSITITPTLTDATATITVNGAFAGTPITLNLGANTIIIVVTAQDGVTTKTYTLTVTRVVSSNADLSNLVLSSGSLIPVFSSNIQSYSANSLSFTNNIIVTPQLADASATATVNGLSPSTPVPLNVGSNIVTINVTAQDSLTTKAYTVTVTRSASPSAGEPDLSFASGSIVNGGIGDIVPAADGKIYISGGFTSVRDALRNGIARLNADGTADASFNPGSGPFGGASSLAVQPDGKLIIAGSFTSYNGTSRNRIARINADGSLDNSFNPGSGVSGLFPEVQCLTLQADGKVLIGGSFSSYNGTPRNRMARLNADGSLDTSFNPSSFNADGSVFSIAVQADGKVLIVGSFTTYNGIARNRIARLNADGSLDTSFNPGSGANDIVRTLALQADGKVLIGGWFSSYNGTARRIARLNANGSLDTTFSPGTGAISDINSIALQTDGKVLIGGIFQDYNGTPRNSIARINANGSLDTSFDSGTGVSSVVIGRVAVQADGKVLIGGLFNSYNGTARNHIARLNANGSLDASFNPGTAANDSIESVMVQPDGKLLIGGFFTNYQGTERRLIARLNADGSLDDSFNPGTGVNSTAYFVLQPDGKILIGGGFTTYNGTARNHIARLNANGSLDTSFNPGTGANSYISTLALQADGKVLIGGGFTSYNGTPRNYIARLNANGSLDTGFNPGTGTNSTVTAIAVQLDGKVIIGGDFTSYNGTSRNYIARLNPNGSLDTSFDPGTGANSSVKSIAMQPDGKLLVGGGFTNYNGTASNCIARLNADGNLDTSFNPGSGANSAVASIALQADGKLLISGSFTNFNGTARNSLARLNSNGSLDTSFNPGSGSNGISTMALQANGKLLIGGSFGGYNGVAQTFLARVLNDPASQIVATRSASRIEWLRGGSAPEIEQVFFDFSADGEVWTVLGSGTKISGGWELAGLSLPTSGQLRARGRSTGGGSSIIEHVQSYSLFNVPTVTAATISDITFNSASGAGEVTSDGGATVTERGLVYATANDPTLATGTKLIAGIGTGRFTANLSSLAPGTTYYVRAYASNSIGTSYSASVSFTTSLASNNADLSDLQLGEGTLSPSFANDTLAYSSVVASSSNSISISPITADPTASVTVNGQPASTPVALNVGNNTITILVTAPNGTTTRSYTLLVTRQTTYDAWASTPNLIEPLADADGDGVSNLLEYALGSNPLSGTSANQPEISTSSLPGEPTYLVYSYTRPKSTGGISYFVEFSSTPSMTSATSAGEYSTVDNGNGTETVTVRDLNTGTTRFARIRVVKNE